ncbi:MAG: hypothetical protein ABIO83_08435 [Ilumatobacteraceae bacterium]
MTSRLISVLVERFGVFRTWSSFARVGVWVIAWCLVIGFVVAPHRPRPADRQREADVPASDVRYLGPVSKQDYAGFIAPDPAADDPFTVAWIGGSEVKLTTVSVAGEVANRIATFGDRRVQIDGYTVVAPRPIDVLAALDSAVANHADAAVISINANWLSDEWSMREWSNLDVANAGLLWSEPGTWPWAASLVSPADIAWRISRGVFRVVENQSEYNERTSDLADALDIVDRPAAPVDAAVAPPVDPDADRPDPRLPADATAFWLVHEYGADVMTDPAVFVGKMVEGLDDASPVADSLNLRLIEHAEAADIPVYLYVHPYSPAALATPEFASAAAQVEQYWAQIATHISSPLVQIQSAVLTPELGDRAAFNDVVHMSDGGPFAELLVPRLCANWQLAHPDLECS